jgi:uncharacterized protein YbjT (DUF2867 family)
MKVLLAGANSYIGARLIPTLLDKGHEVICLVRDKDHFFKTNPLAGMVTVISGDLLRRQSIERFPAGIDAAYYLVNSFTQTSGFSALGVLSAQNFMEALERISCRQIITLSDIQNHTTASADARIRVENILSDGKSALTVLNTTMIVGEGSTAMEMFYALTAKVPIVLAQNWAKTRMQPIATSDVLGYLESVLMNKLAYNRKFDIGGPEILAFKQMLLTYIAIYKDFKPSVVTLPFLTSQISSSLLNTLTPVSYPEAQTLVENLKSDTICRDDSIKEIIPRQCLTFKRALRLVHNVAEKSVPI